MSEHEEINRLLPLYVSGSLDENHHRDVADHLQTCAECRADLELWTAAAGEIVRFDEMLTPPSTTFRKAVDQIHAVSQKKNIFNNALEILRSQTPFVRREIWTVTACILLIGAVAAILVERASLISALAPLIAAASVVVLFGPENDPSIELTLSTPTSPRQILLARLALVFGYDVVLSLGVSLVMVPLIHGLVLLPFVLSWLAPMAFLSAFALLLSLIISAENAITIAYLLWLVQFTDRGLTFIGMVQSGSFLRNFFDNYAQLWRDPQILLIGAVLLGAAAVWLVGRQEFRSLDLA